MFLKLWHPGNSDLTNLSSDHLVYMLKDQQAENPTPIPGVSGWHTPIIDGNYSNSHLSTHLINWGLPAICTLVFPFERVRIFTSRTSWCCISLLQLDLTWSQGLTQICDSMIWPYSSVSSGCLLELVVWVLHRIFYHAINSLLPSLRPLCILWILLQPL